MQLLLPKIDSWMKENNVDLSGGIYVSSNLFPKFYTEAILNIIRNIKSKSRKDDTQFLLALGDFILERDENGNLCLLATDKDYFYERDAIRVIVSSAFDYNSLDSDKKLYYHFVRCVRLPENEIVLRASILNSINNERPSAKDSACKELPNGSVPERARKEYEYMQTLYENIRYREDSPIQDTTDYQESQEKIISYIESLLAKRTYPKVLSYKKDQ